MSRAEISQDLVDGMERYIRDLAKGFPHYHGAQDLVEKLDALEQPADPAHEVSGTFGAHFKCCEYHRKWSPVEAADWCIGDHLPAIIQAAHAEQREAVRELSDYLELHGFAEQKNARVRRLFRFDKEKP